MLEEISWLLNIKATGQHEFDPLFNSALLIIAPETKKSTEVKLFIEDDFLNKSSSFFKGLSFEPLTLSPMSQLGTMLKLLEPDLKIAIDGVSCSQLAFKSLSTKPGRVKELSGADAPVSKLKIIKNGRELKGLRKAMMRESASLVSVYAKIRQSVKDANG